MQNADQHQKWNDMKKPILFIVIIFFYMTEVSSQSCLPQGITFNTQEQVDNFQTNYPGCAVIEGDVLIEGNNIYNLNGLNVLTACNGELKIESDNSLTSLSGLENINSLGALNIVLNSPITDLTGLQGLTNISPGSLFIHDNISLTTLSGLNNLSLIEGGVEISNNSALINIDGLESLSFTKRININYNSSLSNLQGLENLTSVEEDFLLHDNNAIVDLTGLGNLTTIGVKLSINNNSALTSLSGLNSLDSVTHLYINDNISLTTCNIGSICNFLSNPTGSVNIYDNATGCNSPPEISDICGFTMSCLPYGNYYFLSQTDIDDFQTNYTNCTAIEGDIKIAGSDITNLIGLSTITSIGGHLMIYGNGSLQYLSGLDSVNYIGGTLVIYFNSSLNTLASLSKITSIGGSLQIRSNDLTSLSGLDNLTFLGGSLIISNTNLTGFTALSNLTGIGGSFELENNDALINLSGLNSVAYIDGDLNVYKNDSLLNLSGLENVISIEGNLLIGVYPYGGNLSLFSLSGLDYVTNIGGILSIYNNSSLKSLTALSNLTTLGGYFEIFDNQNIESLAGIENIDSETISDLYILDNPSLSYCEVQSVCDYLSTPNGFIYILNNAIGCNAQTEVEFACSVFVSDINNEPKVEIYPNPAKTNISILTKNDVVINELIIYNQQGQKKLQKTNITNKIDISTLGQGLYIIELVTDKNIVREKLIIK
jgi:hypothetical protein